MQVDRKRFLLLTASLAAAACNQRGAAVTPDTGSGEPDDASGEAQAGMTVDASPQVWLEIEPGSAQDPNAAGQKDGCDNYTGQPDSCASFSAPAGHCENFNFNRRLCQGFAEVMVPRAAESSVACMLAGSGSPAVCEWDYWHQCIGAGMQSACIDQNTRTECEQVSAHCGGSVDVFQCQQALSAAKQTLQPRVASCIREFCEVPFCLTDSISF